MLFNSLVFLIFAVLFFAIWPSIQKFRNPRWIFLVIASLIFYGWWDWRFIFLIIFSGLIDFFAGLMIEKKPERKKLYLIISLVGNIGSLALFKYLGFFTQNIAALADAFGGSFPVIRLALPIGISFYTFQSMSYTIDIYKGSLKPTHNIFHFFAYLSLFPQLVAGPIIRASHLLPQLEEERKASDEQVWEGIRLIAYGFFKKVVVADTLGVIVDVAFSEAQMVTSAPYWWAVMTFFAIQIYCDFAGYSDIARGLGKLMGYDFPLNFDHPYISRSLREFWTRWHISLSTWFRDYVFFPLLQKRVTKFNAHKSMWITMLLSGLWHGASWNFVIWGALHAFYFSLERMTNYPKKISKMPGGKHFAAFITIVLVWISWVFFRSGSFAQAGEILSVMLNPFAASAHPIPRFGIIPKFILTLALLREAGAYAGLDEKFRESRLYKYMDPVLVGLALAASVFLRGTGQVFIYFQF